MPVKLRLQRHGRKGYAYYHVVVADSRAPRDGKFIERIGSYNPNTNPATIDLNFDKAIDWLQKGAQPTDTCRAMLRYKGVIYKKHLLDGVRKGAFTLEVAEERFQDFLKKKESAIQAKKDGLSSKEDADLKARLEAESKVREAKAKTVAAKRAAMVAKNAPAPAAAEETAAADESPAEA
ncbi:30S ribosomal protein S16 [Williamwhitmania taraxaci]|uniref:Small ribosomal subunit protein bS16 n=1 Tax=Williamwhitmania taraxaci TaxID=1640674 RepID=A0A1G6KQE3_9BACT|nr:30S ribosomal protein S16 [Williamwhitmania taraxaci]SDC33183.1 small subunit ribosomal protein S16 [Williamwhitmania taraxaci]